jgi:hypothetical protein
VMRSSEPCLVLCERTSRWADRVRRYVHQSRLKVIETRSLTECSERLSEYPSAIVGLELTKASFERTTAWWLRIVQTFPQARVLALCDRLPRGTDDLCRELGAIDIMTSELDSLRLHGLVDRYLSQAAFETLKGGSDDLVARIRSRLPWSGTPSSYVSQH